MMKYLSILLTLILVVSCDTSSDQHGNASGLKLELRDQNNQKLNISTLKSLKVDLYQGDGTSPAETSGCITPEEQHVGFYLKTDGSYTVKFSGYLAAGCSGAADWQGEKTFQFTQTDDPVYVSLLVTKAETFVLSSFPLNSPRAFFNMKKDGDDAVLLLGGVGSSYSRINPLGQAVASCEGQTASCIERNGVSYLLKTVDECKALGATQAICESCLDVDESGNFVNPQSACLFNCPSTLDATCTLRGSKTINRVNLDGGVTSETETLPFTPALSTAGSLGGVDYIIGGSGQLELKNEAPFLYHINQNISGEGDISYDMITGTDYSGASIISDPARHILTDFQSVTLDNTLYIAGGTTSGYNNNTYTKNSRLYACTQDSGKISCDDGSGNVDNIGGKLFCIGSSCYLYGGLGSTPTLSLGGTDVTEVDGDLFRPELITVNGSVYATGGMVINGGDITADPNNKIYRFDQTNEVFQQLTVTGDTLPTLFYASYTPYKDGILVIGGLSSGTLSKNVYHITFSGENATVTTLGTLNHGRIGHGVYVDGENIWVMGGIISQSGQLSITRSIEIYTPAAE